MGQTKKYLLNHFASTFLSLFGTLFFIISITFFVKISKITAVIEVTFFELGKLYLFVLPQILLFTLPLSFFIGLALALFRLSKENETIVLFTLGYSPIKMAIFFGILSLLTTVFLLINSLVLIPISDQLNKNFIDFKKNEARLNLNPSEYGQRFSDWMVFIKSKSDTNNTRTYNDIIMYQMKNNKNQERIVLANSATIKHDKGALELGLYKGNYYDLSPSKIHKSKFSNMTIRSENSDKLRKVGSILEYWKKIKTSEKRAKNFALYTLISLFPLASFLFAISFGVVTYRYQKNEIYGSLFITIALYFSLTVLAGKYYPLIGIVAIFLLFILLSSKYFHKKIVTLY